MNNLSPETPKGNNISIYGQTSSLTMSSREIAELCGKQHKHVLRDIEKMFDDLRIGRSKFGRTYLSKQNKEMKEYLLDEDLSLTLVSGYSSELRFRIVQKFNQYRNSPFDPKSISKSYLANLVLESEAEKEILMIENKRQEEEISSMEPKVSFFDQFMNADGLYGLQNAARALKCRPNLFIRWLKKEYLFYQGGNLVSKIRFTQMGVFEVISKMVDGVARPQSFITPKGLKYLETRVPDEIRISGEGS